MAPACGVFTTQTGSVVCIPENALVDDNGQPVRGKVAIRYRELHTPLQMILAGVEMRAKNGSSTVQLVSSGMFELEASQNGRPIKLRKGKQASVRFRTFFPQDNNILYRYDDKAQLWDGLQNPVQQMIVPEEMPTTTAVAWGGDVTPAEGDGGEWDTEGQGGQTWSENWDGNWDGEWGEPVDTTSEWYQRNKVRNQYFLQTGIDEFGLYNYDKPVDENEVIRVLAKVQLPDNQGLLFDKAGPEGNLYLVFENLNTVLHASNAEELKERIFFYPNQRWKLIAIYASGTVARLDDADLLPTRVEDLRGKQHTFKVYEMYGYPFSNENALSNALGIN